MKYFIALFFVLFTLFLSACQADVCPTNSVEYVTDPSLFPTLASPSQSRPTPTPSLIKIGGRMIEFDRVIHGPLCNDTWSGTVYVACNIQIVEWTEEEGATFLKDCNLTIEPETVVYVAAHNNAAYYNGCFICHVTGESK